MSLNFTKCAFFFFSVAILGPAVILVWAQEENEVTIPMGAYSPLCKKNDKCYAPSNLIIEKGSTVTWINRDYALHTVTSGTIWSGHDGVFNSKILNTGDKFDFTFDKVEAGTYPYYCIMHPWMQGTIIVDSQPEFQAEKVF